MFVKFNYDNFPNVHVTFGKLNSNEDFNILTNEWLRLYEQKIPFRRNDFFPSSYFHGILHGIVSKVRRQCQQCALEVLGHVSILNC